MTTSASGALASGDGRPATGRWDVPRLLAWIGLSAAIWGVVAVACLCVGSTGGIGWPDNDDVLAPRLELVLLASLVGAALAASGVVYQAILRNPLADPYLLGVSTGASLFSYLWQFAPPALLVASLGALSQQAFAFAGALTAMALVFAIAGARGRLEPMTLILTGVIVNAVNASLFLLLTAINRDRPAQGGPLGLLVGGIHATLTGQQKNTATVIVAVGWLVVLWLSGTLNVASLSDAEAQSLGVRINRLRWIALLVASLMTASAVALTGPIGFVGLVCPHLARLIAGPDVRRLLPLATGIGAALLAAADAASRYLAPEGRAETRLPVGVLTGLLGGPFFLLLLWQSRRRVGAGAGP